MPKQVVAIIAFIFFLLFALINGIIWSLMVKEENQNTASLKPINKLAVSLFFAVITGLGFLILTLNQTTKTVNELGFNNINLQYIFVSNTVFVVVAALFWIATKIRGLRWLFVIFIGNTIASFLSTWIVTILLGKVHF